ncbi:MAG: glycosyltransferase family 39 protein, partial [Acidimicrobiia bacterium]
MISTNRPSAGAVLSRVKLSVIIGLLTVAAVSLAASVGLALRAIGPAPVSSIVATLLTGVVLCLAGAVVLSAANGSSELPQPSEEPRIVGWTVAGVGLAIVAIGVGSAVLGGTTPGVVESAALVGGALVAMAGYPAYRLAQAGTLDRWIGPNGRFVLSPGEGGLWTKPAETPWYRASVAELAVALGLTAILAVTYLMILSNGPLGNDEATYAVKARSWLEGTPSTGFYIYRPVGMPAIGWMVLQVSDSEVAFRLVGVAAAVATLGGMWGVGRRLFSPAAGLLAAAAIGSATSWLRRVPEFLNDIITTGLLLWIMFVIWRHFEDPEQPRWRVTLAAPLAAAAFYLRYGI